MFRRIILSFIVLGIVGFFTTFYTSSTTLLLGNIAGSQFDNSNISYLMSSQIFSTISQLNNLVYAASFLALLIIWWKPAKQAIMTSAAVALGLMLVMHSTPSSAYYDTVDKTEAYTVLPNETAFWIPDVGANKDSQGKLDSEEYYNALKVPLKRFVVPHQKLSGSAGNSMFSGWDSYVPTGRLIIVDRTPQSREWVRGETRGTSKVDESFPCQSNEGLNIEVGISIGVSVKEADAARYLYNFGVLPPTVRGSDGNTYLANRNDPATIFTSVYYGRSLSNVTDDVVRKKIQTLVCNEIASRTFDEANKDQVKIINSVEVQATKYLNDYGITLTFIGYADTWNFDPSVQKAVNDNYESQKLKDMIPVLQAVTQLKVQEGLADGLRIHGLPMVITPDILNAIENIAGRINAVGK